MSVRTVFPNASTAYGNLPIHVTTASDWFEGSPIQRPWGYDDHQIALCVGGSGTFSCAGKTHAISERKLFFFRNGLPHAYAPDGPGWMLKWAAFSGVGSMAVLDYLHFPSHAVFCVVKPEVDHLFDRLVAEMNRGEDFRASLLLQELLGLLADTAESSEEQDRLQTVVRHIRARYADCITAEELAGLFGSSVSYLCRVFRSVYDTTPIDFLTQHRISVAKSLLLDSDRDIREIAALTGYSHPNYFCTVFRRHAGCSPTGFRKRFGLTRLHLPEPARTSEAQ